MPRTVGETNTMRRELAGSALNHTNEAMVLEEGESMSATYALADNPPTVTLTATLKLVKTYDPATDASTIYPYEVDETP